MGFTLTDVLLFGGAKESDVDSAAFAIMRRNILRWGAIGGYVSIVVHGVSPLVLPDAIANSLSYVKAFGGTEQNGTPTPDAPVDIVSNNGVIKYGQYSNNIFNKDDTANIDSWYCSASLKIATAAANQTLVMRSKPGATYYFKHCSVTGGGRAFYTEVEDWAVGSDCSTMVGSATIDKDEVKSITVSANAKWVFFNYGRSGQTATFEEQLADFMVSLTTLTSDTPYEPYRFGIHVDGTTETINAHGKNLNGGGELGYQGYTSTGGTSTSTTFCGTLWKIKVNPGEKYTLSYGNFPDGVSGVFTNTWLTDGTWNLRQAIAISGAYTYTIPAGVGEVNFTLYKTGGITIADDSWMQVEAGETATEYEPYYDGGTATAEMLLKVDNYQDEQEILSGVVTRKVGVKVLDGTENVGTSNATFTITIADRVTSKTPLICSHFEYSTKTSSQVENLKVISFSSTNIGFRYDACANATAFKTWLADQYAAGTPVIVVYPLATPTTESVTGQTLQVTDGDNTLEITQASLNGLELEAQYNAAVSLTIQEVQDANLDNNVTVTIQ